MSERCAICGGPIEGYGNNADPLAKGKCCDRCNAKVISARIDRMMENRREI